MIRNGDFLVRDSLTSVGDYVLTCRWDHEVLHFKISKVLVKANDTKVNVKAVSFLSTKTETNSVRRLPFFTDES